MVDSFKEILSKYTIEEDITVGGYTFRLERIKDCEPLLDNIDETEFDEDERIPYWAELWPSSIALADFVLEHRGVFLSKSVIEIGCGLGLTGMAAHVAGADVLFTDYDQYALEYTKNNFFRNFNQPAQVQMLDWRKQDIDRKFDILIAADVLYEKRWLQPVLDTIGACVKPDGWVYLAEPGRSIASEFFKMIDDSSWKYKKLEKIINFESAIKHVDIYEIKLC